MEEKNFADFVAAQEQAKSHAEEIQNTRVGGLGGSDAAMVLKLGLHGLNSLSVTDTKRLCVMLGICDPDTWGGNVYTNAGHAFEDLAEQTLPFGRHGYEREKVFAMPLALSFKTFAHADFACGKEHNDVIECKFVQDATPKVVQKYYAQLQWYYMLGASHVTLYHGRGKSDPFELEEGTVRTIERDEQTIEALLAGVKLLDDAIQSGWQPVMPDKVVLSDTPAMVQAAFNEYADVCAQMDALKERKTAAAAILSEYIAQFGYTGIQDDGEKKRQVLYSTPNVSASFDSGKFLQAHPEYYELREYWKETEKAGFVSLR